MIILLPIGFIYQQSLTIPQVKGESSEVNKNFKPLNKKRRKVQVKQ
jgi:hypothetical protein